MTITISPFWGAVLGGLAGYVLARRGDLTHVGDPTPLVGGIAGAALGGWALPQLAAAWQPTSQGITINTNPTNNTPNATSSGTPPGA